MIYHPKSYKAAAWLLALSLTAGGTVSAAAVPYDTTSSVTSTDAVGATASTTPFSDVVSGHWAEKHISKLAFQGIIVGNNGSFRPSDSVTRQEAIVMAIRFAGLEDQLNLDEAVVFPSSFHVDNYFVPYVVLAFEKGLIDQNDQFAIADKEGKDWGSAKASREWVTKLIVKAIGKNADAEALANQSIPFDDASAVGDGYAGYINEAVNLKLMNGVANNKFDPAGAVTRAMMAKLLSLAEGEYPVSYEGQTEGILTTLEDGTIGLYTDNGDQTYSSSASTVYARSDSEQLTTASNLVPYAPVSVIVKDGAVQYIEQLSTEQQVETINGTFERAVSSTNTLFIWPSGADDYLKIPYSNNLQVLDSNGNTISLSEVPAGAEIKVLRDKYRQTPTAISIQIAGDSQTKSGSGTVQSVGTTSITINNNGTSETWDIASNALLLNGNTLITSLSEIKAGDTITYEVKNGELTKLVVESTNAAKTETGTFYSSDSKTITYVKDNKYITKPIISSTVVYIEGLPTSQMTDLQDGDQLELTINASDQVTKISVQNRKVEMAVGTEILGYYSDQSALSVVDGNGKILTLYFNSDSQIDLNGTVFTIETAVASGLLTKGRKITISYTGDTIVRVQLAFRYTGTVVSVSTSTSKITMSMNGTLMTLPLDSPFVESYNSTSTTLADIQTGDTITAAMNSDQDKVSGIYIHRTVQMKVVSVNASTNKLMIREGSGTAVEYSAGSIDMLDENGNTITVGSLAAGNVVNVTFVGSTPSSVQRVSINVGAVTSVDANQIQLVNYSGQTVTVPLGSSYTIKRNGVSSTSYTTLKTGDRVETSKDTKGNVLITVLTSEEKTFFKYDATTDTIQTKRQVVTDTNYKFTLTNISLTSGGTTIEPTSLVDGDTLVLYYYDGKVIEIAKQ
ncbi:S-layer family protein [Paenibacillus cellulosilyticus]|uniref:S-layer family protein n=1 Tax=Paenibacillus cellulosilyticus TaxID=375489 RepID=A0A2V2YVV8_9BACL|nr:S-layer homology domain-containing protein [Paenibacillus cellulosilyticus]PWW05486.1 S-layer family protein [Paenibacillus cellulosilyticus]QKS45474.1 S-layer homology domain-containing protein [Paenibacillus cellulosilyticus]